VADRAGSRSTCAAKCCSSTRTTPWPGCCRSPRRRGNGSAPRVAAAGR
jgi:hypothetical protein